MRKSFVDVIQLHSFPAYIIIFLVYIMSILIIDFAINIGKGDVKKKKRK